MKAKRIFYCELAYPLGVFLLAAGAAFMVQADFGVSMVVAPAYLLHLKLQPYWAPFTYGMAGYAFEALLIVILSIVMKRAKISYLFSFITAVIYGLMLDLVMMAVSLLPVNILLRVVYYVIGVLMCTFGVALLFRSYFVPEAYELFVKEVSAKFGYPIGRVKTIYDCCSCLLAIVLSFVFFGFGHFEGVKLGSILCVFVNGWLIGQMGKGLEKRFVFQDALPLRRFFEK